ncbi:MAG TPA: hypothetical protein VJ907_05890 [Halanaerobiales bacterium]|nr:hypothetical protein [Halanaerobiales bacterium]
MDRNWKPKTKGDHKDLISTDNRRIITKQLKMAKSNLVAHIYKLRNVGLLVDNEDGGTEVNPYFIMNPNEEGIVEFNIIFKCHEQQSEEK